MEQKMLKELTPFKAMKLDNDGVKLIIYMMLNPPEPGLKKAMKGCEKNFADGDYNE